MTHQGNYGFKERLAIHLFSNVTRFIKKWTRLQLHAPPPTEMAKKYFELFPRNIEPQWGVSLFIIPVILYCRLGEATQTRRPCRTRARIVYKAHSVCTCAVCSIVTPFLLLSSEDNLMMNCLPVVCQCFWSGVPQEAVELPGVAIVPLRGN